MSNLIDVSSNELNMQIYKERRESASTISYDNTKIIFITSSALKLSAILFGSKLNVTLLICSSFIHRKA